MWLWGGFGVAFPGLRHAYPGPGRSWRVREKSTVQCSRPGALASKLAWTLRLDFGEGEVVGAAQNHRAKAAAPVQRQAFTSVLTQ